MSVAQKVELKNLQKKLLIINEKSDTYRFSSLESLEEQFKSGDTLVINEGLTLPGSFSVTTVQGETFEIRLAELLSHPEDYKKWRVIAFGQGSHLLPTELRGRIPHLKVGEYLTVNRSLYVKIKEIDPDYPRVLTVNFFDKNKKALSGHRLVFEMFKAGSPIQYSYLKEKLKVWDQQSYLASFPISVEPASSHFQLNHEFISLLKKKGVNVVSITHGTGLSDLGSAEYNNKLPFSEWSYISRGSLKKIRSAHYSGKNIYAIGTGVIRSLESLVLNLNFNGGWEKVHNVIVADDKLKVVSGFLTGMHEEGSSHLNILGAGANRKLIERAYKHSIELGFDWHEYGDLTWIQKSQKVPGPNW